MNGTWKPGFYYGSIKDGFTGLAKYGPKVSAKTKALIAKYKKLIVQKKFNEFCGPVKDQSGKVRIPKGKCASITDLYSMQYLVKGVIGSIPKVPSG
jgi:basic membrane protein A